VRYATVGAFRTALEQRLSRLAQQTDVPLVRLRKLVVFDRLMARLMAVAPNRWVLKGAVAIHCRVGPQFRTTKDMDIGRQDSEEAATADFLTVQSVNLGDHFTFTIERTGRLDPALEGAAVRYHVTAQLAGRPFEDVTVDVGFGEPPFGEPELVRGPDLLSFAEIAPAEVPALPLEQHVAEKVHAYTRSYAGGNPSTRVKDLIDLVVISSFFSFQAGRLRGALENTFGSRATHALPLTLPSPPSQWRIPYHRMAIEVGLDQEVSEGYKQATAFLDPILQGQVPDEACWDPTKYMW
jgi:hypothetical protein